MRAFLPLAFVLFACGPKYHFSGGAQPEWVAQVVSNKNTGRLQTVGMSPLTSNVQHDTELAVRDAKARIAEMFISEVDSRLTVWTMALENDGQGTNRDVVQNNIQIRSRVKIEDVKILKSHRDKATKSQYVLLTIDKDRWESKLQKRIDQKLEALVSARDNASASQSAQTALKTLQNLRQGYKIGGELEPDIIVIDLLRPENKVAEKVRKHKKELDLIGKATLAKHPFHIEVLSEDEKNASDMEEGIGNFLLERGPGFNDVDNIEANPACIQIKISISQEFIKEESVGNRIEYIHAARGKIQVKEPNGSVFNEMTISLRPNVHTVRAQNRQDGRSKALKLAAETLTSKFRSKFRQAILDD